MHLVPKRFLDLSFRVMGSSGKMKSAQCDPDMKSIKQISQLMTQPDYHKDGITPTQVAQA